MDDNTKTVVSFPAALFALISGTLTATGILGTLIWFNIYIWSLVF